MKQNLLKTWLVMLCMLVGIGSAWGEKYTITFATSASDGSTTIAANTQVSTVVSAGASYVSSFTSTCSKAYHNSIYGVKLGSSSANGTLEFNIATDYQSNIKSITVKSVKYGSDTGTITLYTGSTSLKTGITPGTDYTHTFTKSTNVSSIKLSTSAKRAYISEIVLETDGGGTTPKTDITNTKETAYSVSEAIELINNESTNDLTKKVYVKGIVSEIVIPWSDQYNNITYNISADGTTTASQFQLYRCATNNAEVGDNVIAYGTLKKYNSTYEFEAGNTIVDIQKPAAKIITALAVSGTPTKTTYNVGDKFDTTGLVVTATYSDDTTAPIAEGFEWEIDYGTGNEALVAGATSVDVMVYTEDGVMSEIYTVNGLTVNVPVTLTSIAVSGTPTKTAYYAGDAFETAGLVVTGTYSDGTTATITDGIEWTVDPETLTLGTTSVEVIAGVGSVVSEVYTVSGLTVTENPYKTATISSFSATSGDINADIAYEAFKGDASTAPAVNNNNLRLYQNGGYVTVKAIPGLKIASVKITTSATYESTTVGYCVDDEDAPTTGETVAKSSDYTISNLNNNSVSIYCLGTDKNTRLEIAAIEVKYTGTVVAELKSIELSGTYPTEFNKGAEFSHEGMTVTANYTDNSNADVTSNATFSGYDTNTLGEQTVTVSYTEDNITKTAEYTITVNKAPFVPTPAPAGYETVDFAALYSSVTTNATVEDYEGTSFAMAFAKPQSSSNPTKYYDNGKAVRAYEGNTITITGAEPITYVDIKWVSGYIDDAVSVTGIGTTTAVVTFSKTCRFTAITVDYRSFTVTTADTDFYSLYLNYPVTIPENVTAYTGKLNGNSLNLTKIEGGVIPAKTGVVFKTPESAGKAEFMPCADVDPFKDNDIQGVAQKTEISAINTTGTILVLGMVNGKVGFALPAEGVTTLAANKAYIIVNPAAAAKGVTFVVDEATAINSVNTENNNSAVYNLAGQRVNANTKGIVIVNGKKMLNK